MKILFVCTGNTCRSPMAEGLMKKLLSDEDSDDTFISSAGIAVYEPEPVSEYAAEVMKKRGIDISSHKSRQITAEDVEKNDLILTMTNSQKNILLDLYPQFRDKILTVNEFCGEEGDVYDPFGKSLEFYEKCAEILEDLVKKIAKKLGFNHCNDAQGRY